MLFSPIMHMSDHRSEFVKVLYGIKSVFHAWTAMRRARDHEEAVEGLSLRHFVIGAVIAGALFVTLVLTLVKIVTR
jgi:hypothetical protein